MPRDVQEATGLWSLECVWNWFVSLQLLALNAIWTYSLREEGREGCCSFISAPVTNILTKRNLGKKGVIWLRITFQSIIPENSEQELKASHSISAIRSRENKHMDSYLLSTNSSFYTVLDSLSRERRHLQWTRSSSVNYQSRQPPTDMFTGQPNQKNSSLRHPSKRF